MEYIWHMEETDFEPSDGLELPTEEDDISGRVNRWFMRRVVGRAVRLWKGEQVGEYYFDWKGVGCDAEGWYFPEYYDLLSYPSAVMAGYRYITSFKSTPRYLRAPMHPSLFRRSVGD